MAISKETLVEVVGHAVESMRQDIKADLREYIEGAIESHRRSVWVKDRWCCEDMQTFAAHVWLLSNPPNREPEFFVYLYTVSPESHAWRSKSADTTSTTAPSAASASAQNENHPVPTRS